MVQEVLTSDQVPKIAGRWMFIPHVFLKNHRSKMVLTCFKPFLGWKLRKLQMQLLSQACILIQGLELA